MHRSRLNRGRVERAPFRHRRETMVCPAGSEALVHAQHHAVMLSVSAAAGGQIAVCPTRGEQRRDQREADEQQKRDGNDAAHGRL